METPADEDKQMLPLYNLLPAQVRRKIRALKKLQYNASILEAKYFYEVHKLECKYASLHSDVFAKRARLIDGKDEPTDDDCDFKEEGYDSPDENDEALLDLRKKLANMHNFEEEVKGIPDFWLTVLRNTGKTFDLVQPQDEPILKHLKDIQVTLQSEPMGFVIGFKFSPNPYFSNRVLTKEYEMRCTVDDLSPWSFDGPEIIKAKGTQIDWKKGMNVTKRVSAKKKDVKAKDSRSSSDKADSFFNFFTPPLATDCQGEKCGELHCKLAEDYALGIFIREKLVPNAVLYFTGDAYESDSSSEESESESSGKSGVEEEYGSSPSAEEDNPE